MQQQALLRVHNTWWLNLLYAGYPAASFAAAFAAAAAAAGVGCVGRPAALVQHTAAAL
jgi:hypothetical protein